MSDIVEKLRNYGLGHLKGTPTLIEEVVAEIERLQERCNMQAAILQRLFPGTPFITSVGGEIDKNRMPEFLYVVPEYGCDFSYVYKRTDKTVGPEW